MTKPPLRRRNPKRKPEYIARQEKKTGPGKGDRQRSSDKEKFDKGYDEIDWTKE